MAIGVYYCRTDGEPGYKEYSYVVLEVNGSTPDIRYSHDIYDSADCKVLYEYPPSKIKDLEQKVGVKCNHTRGWVSGPIKDEVLRCWRDRQR